MWLQNITVVTIKVFMYATGDYIRFVSRLLFRNKWFHHWLVEINVVVSCVLYCSFFLDSLSSDNTAFLRHSASKTTEVHGKRRNSQGGAKKKWGLGRVG